MSNPSAIAAVKQSHSAIQIVAVDSLGRLATRISCPGDSILGAINIKLGTTTVLAL